MLKQCKPAERIYLLVKQQIHLSFITKFPHRTIISNTVSQIFIPKVFKSQFTSLHQLFGVLLATFNSCRTSTQLEWRFVLHSLVRQKFVLCRFSAFEIFTCKIFKKCFSLSNINRSIWFAFDQVFERPYKNMLVKIFQAISMRQKIYCSP